MIQYPLKVQGVGTRVLDAGDGERVVVFIHGLSTRADRWRETLQRFAGRGYRAIALDLPGHGLADKPADFDYTSPGLADYCLAALAELGVERFDLVGTSLGGHVAALMTLRAPRRVRSLHLVGALGIAPISDAVGEAIRASVRTVSPEGIRAKLQGVFHDQAFVTEQLVREETLVNGADDTLAALCRLADYVATRLNQDLVAEPLLKLQDPPPLHLLWTDLDRVVPLEVGERASQLLDQPLHVMRGVGHAPYVERPEEFVTTIIGFMDAA
ncbi:alpha/beta fold hydrolase [Alloalcanivorax marinus]|uniref:alpha/beta fold hydrolase n=1 Tax=Alloalcanivorax marinus TaxID=1177169 RepID=UPI0019332B7D|nr:alpha/beta fold hydrolase [Alloalcanivorax marinus]MBL7249594.1 alpha/beta fold hydrolase [Alloalcanivorax marinus]